MPSTVLIITNDHDSHADHVVRELHRRDIPVFRFHPEDFPGACSVSIEIQDGRIDGEIKNAHHRVALRDVCAAWFRRSRNLHMGRVNATSEKLADYVNAQSGATLAALFESLHTFWIGHPLGLRRADVKALHLAAASMARLKTPMALVSNVSVRAVALAQSLRGAQCALKTLSVNVV